MSKLKKLYQFVPIVNDPRLTPWGRGFGGKLRLGTAQVVGNQGAEFPILFARTRIYFLKSNPIHSHIKKRFRIFLCLPTRTVRVRPALLGTA